MNANEKITLHDLRANSAWSWYELAQEYGITTDYARLVFAQVKEALYLGEEILDDDDANEEEPEEITTNEEGTNEEQATEEEPEAFDGLAWLDWAPREYNTWGVVEEAARIQSLITTNHGADARVASGEVGGMALALELLSGQPGPYDDAEGYTWRAFINDFAAYNYTDGRRNEEDEESANEAQEDEAQANDDLPTAEEISGLDAPEALALLGDEGMQEDGERYDALLEHIGENIVAWYLEARADEGADEIAQDLRDIAETVFDTDLEEAAEERANEEQADRDARADGAVEAWLILGRGGEAAGGILSEAAEAARQNPGNVFTAGVFEGAARLAAALVADAGGANGANEEELLAAIYRWHGVAR